MDNNILYGSATTCFSLIIIHLGGLSCNSLSLPAICRPPTFIHLCYRSPAKLYSEKRGATFRELSTTFQPLLFS